MKFALDDPQIYRNPANNDFEEIFYIDEMSMDQTADVAQHINELFSGKIKIQVNLEYEGDIQGSLDDICYDVAIEERDFQNQIDIAEKCAEEGFQEKWVSEIPHSKELDDIINKRLYLWRNVIRLRYIPEFGMQCLHSNKAVLPS